MATFDECLQLQFTDISIVNRIVPNFKKMGQANFTIPLIDRRIEHLKEIRNNVVSRHTAMRSLIKPEVRAATPYYQKEQFNDLMDRIEDDLDYFAELRVSLLPVSSASVQIPATAPVSNSKPRIKLPAIELPKFDGAVGKWETFRDRFTTLIISDKLLTNLERMHHLYSALSGEALESISHLKITEDNFECAWEIISNQYENERRLVTEHLRTLFSIPAVRSNSAKSIRSLRDTITGALQSLINLKRPVEKWDDLIVHLVITKLDTASRSALELKLSESTKFPTYAVIDDFLQSRTRMLEALSQSQTLMSESISSVKSPKPTKISSLSATTFKTSCIACKQDHPLYRCTVFLSYSISRRRELISDHKRCFNCFGSGHSAPNCSNPHRCRQCSKKHHTLLHILPDSSPRVESPSTPLSAPTDVTPSVNALTTFNKSQSTSVLLATAQVIVHSPDGKCVRVRALLDQGSEATFITEHLAKLLCLASTKADLSITGIGGTQTVARRVANISIGPVANDKERYSTVAIILPKLVTSYATHTFSPNTQWIHLQNLPLADNNPFCAAPYDIIIGADLYGSLLRDGMRVGRPDEPVAQNTVLGWILSGRVKSDPPSSTILAHHVSFTQLSVDLRKFWEIENVATTIPLLPNDQQCEDHFISTHSRDESGRYIVRLPFKTGSPPNLPSSYATALSNLQRLEKRLHRDPVKAAAYIDFMREYEEFNHMEKLSKDEIPTASEPYYLPHHAVFRESSLTTKLRVVFNASSKMSNGQSLNDYLSPGPKLQTDLGAIILRWRQFRYVLTADITKMYRQIRVHPEDADYQRILWRASPTDPVEIYRLTTVTYGTASAPFLALRVLKQLAIDEGASFPFAASVIQNQTYVDDCIFGSDKIDLAVQTRDQLISLFHNGGFQLHKWASNQSSLLSGLKDTPMCSNGKELGINEAIKILGILWRPDLDVFSYKLNPAMHDITTKRTVLSTIATLFDVPLGWIAPVIVTAKILMQRLWLLSCDWDDDLPLNVQEDWSCYKAQLPYLESLSIPRWTEYGPDCHTLELHGFADASEKAYAAVIYLRVRDPSGMTKVFLLTAKSRVAPIKFLSIPRLELCAALLLSELITYTREALHFSSIPCHCWSDSVVTLAWLNQPSSKWKPFVAHRVAKIQEVSENVTWHHVPTSDNPADCASRGLYPREILQHSLWWSGPTWLQQPATLWPQPLARDKVITNLEERSSVAVNNITLRKPWSLQSRYSSWSKLIRVTGIIMRFVHCLRLQLEQQPHVPRPLQTGPLQHVRLSIDDLNKARIFWIQQIQANLFPTELSTLQSAKTVSKSSPLSALCPYLDSNNLIRVQGRLRFAPWLDEKKHPIIIGDHPLVRLLISSVHLQLLHAGPQLTLAHLRNTYWILRSRQLVRSVLYHCVSCARAKAQIPEEFMGDLPAVRVTATTRAFLHTGVDYAGPIVTRNAKGRGCKTYKSYISVFVCMTTKAVHLELVTNYSSDAFIAAYKRFVSRRGLPSDLYSDNGTTFRGAERELAESYRSAVREPNFANCLVTEGTTWHFLPPAAPHFGGLWEAAVRSVKTHLKRCIGAHTLTYEELMTLLCCIEACLNSRPITAISDCLEDYNALTPGHFLINGPLVAPPESSVLSIQENRLTRWKVIQRLYEQFWNSWRREYLHTLQQRPKWRVRRDLTKVGQLVLLRDPGLPPSHWTLARIIECHPGADGLIRVVTVKTPRAEYKRPITQLCFLPVDINHATQDNGPTVGGHPVDRPDPAPIP